MSKYQPLEGFLRTQPGDEVPVTFGEIERVLGFRLPPAAHAHRAWWSNNASNNVMTKSWLAAGFVSEQVDMASERLVFRRKEGASSWAGVSEGPTPKFPAPGPGLLERVQVRLGGTVTIPDGVDLTAPTGEIWDAER